MHGVMLKLLFAAGVGAFVAVAGCSSSSSSASSGCSAETTCANGAGSMQACYTQDATGACATLSYKVGSHVFDCVSCDDEAYCKNAALVACGVPEASIPADADLPDGLSLAGDSGAAGEGGGASDSGAPSDTGPDAEAAAEAAAGDAAHD
jgi:hypothetical protein